MPVIVATVETAYVDKQTLGESCIISCFFVRLLRFSFCWIQVQPGFHTWHQQLQNHESQVRLLGRNFGDGGFLVGLDLFDDSASKSRDNNTL